MTNYLKVSVSNVARVLVYGLLVFGSSTTALGQIQPPSFPSGLFNNEPPSGVFDGAILEEPPPGMIRVGRRFIPAPNATQEDQIIERTTWNALDYTCIKTKLDDILESYTREIALLRDYNAQLERIRNESGFFNDIVEFVVYSGRNERADPYSTQIRFNNQRITNLLRMRDDHGPKTTKLADDILKEEDPKTQLTMTANLLQLVNVLRRMKGIPELNPFCEPNMLDFQGRFNIAAVSDEQWAVHAEAIEVSKDVTVAVITSVGGVVGVAAGGTSAATISVSRVLSYALIGCFDGVASARIDMLLNDMKKKDENGATVSLTEDEIFEELAGSCALGSLLGGGPGATKKFFQDLGMPALKKIFNGLRKRNTPADPGASGPSVPK